MRIFTQLTLLLVMTFSMTGCWNQTELNEIGLISAIGIDRSGDKWIVSYQLINPSAISSGAGGAGKSGGSEAPIHVFSSTGPTLREAIDVSYTESARRLYFPHTDILVLGQQATEKGISEIMDFYWRNTYMRETVNVLVTNGQASELLKQLVPTERLPGAAIANILEKTDQFNGNYPSTKMYELALSLDSESQAAGVPQIELVGGPEAKVDSVDQLHKTSTRGKLKITGLSVFDKDRRIGTLTRSESFGISWLTDKVSISTLSIPCPESNTDREQISFQSASAKTKVTPHKTANGYQMRVSVKVKGTISESHCHSNLTSLPTLHAAQKEIEKVIKDYMEQGWEAAKRLKVDLPHFADKIHRKYPKDWQKLKERWKEEEMQSLQLVLEVDATISQTGMSQTSFRETGALSRPLLFSMVRAQKGTAAYEPIHSSYRVSMLSGSF